METKDDYELDADIMRAYIQNQMQITALQYAPYVSMYMTETKEKETEVIRIENAVRLNDKCGSYNLVFIDNYDNYPNKNYCWSVWDKKGPFKGYFIIDRVVHNGVVHTLFQNYKSDIKEMAVSKSAIKDALGVSLILLSLI